MHPLSFLVALSLVGCVLSQCPPTYTYYKGTCVGIRNPRYLHVGQCILIGDPTNLLTRVSLDNNASLVDPCYYTLSTGSDGQRVGINLQVLDLANPNNFLVSQMCTVEASSITFPVYFGVGSSVSNALQIASTLCGQYGQIPTNATTIQALDGSDLHFSICELHTYNGYQTKFSIDSNYGIINLCAGDPDRYTLDTYTFQTSASVTCPNCLNGGTCSSEFTCSCPLQYTGPLCANCTAGFYVYGSRCVPTCPQAMYPANGVCNACPENCHSCTSATCSQCLAPFVLSSGKCVTSCPTNLTPVNGICTAPVTSNSDTPAATIVAYIVTAIFIVAIVGVVGLVAYYVYKKRANAPPHGAKFAAVAQDETPSLVAVASDDSPALLLG